MLTWTHTLFDLIMAVACYNYFCYFYLQVYCSSHVPKSGPGHFDQTSVGIRQAMNVPKGTNLINDQIRGSSRDHFDGKSQRIYCV